MMIHAFKVGLAFTFVTIVYLISHCLKGSTRILGTSKKHGYLVLELVRLDGSLLETGPGGTETRSKIQIPVAIGTETRSWFSGPSTRWVPNGGYLPETGPGGTETRSKIQILIALGPRLDLGFLDPVSGGYPMVDVDLGSLVYAFSLCMEYYEYDSF
ncbi:hypothetical protein V6N12_027739 [Hibiscus sabdariffa]|uniref:Uncharacterized protein n=1 Tax=Hibiscus sabdariffa TaxID=183260 RepID=A0ABR2F3V1_9ROSI